MEPMDQSLPRLVVHVPHASLYVPEDVRRGFTAPWPVVEAEAEASADLWTDLLARQAWPQAE